MLNLYLNRKILFNIIQKKQLLLSYFLNYKIVSWWFEKSKQFWMLPEIDFTGQINKEQALENINTITGLNLKDTDIEDFQDIYIDNQKTTMFKSFETKYLLIIEVNLDYENFKTKCNSPYFYKQIDSNPKYDYIVFVI